MKDKLKCKSGGIHIYFAQACDEEKKSERERAKLFVRMWKVYLHNFQKRRGAEFYFFP
jgi:hypothetical protein